MTPQEVQRVGFPCNEQHSDGIEKHNEVHGHLLEPEVIINVKQESQVNSKSTAKLQHKDIITYLFIFILGSWCHYLRKYTGRFIMFSMITNIYNKKTKGPTLMELFTATGKLKKFFLTTRDVRCVHHG